MAYPYITQVELESRVSAQVVRRVLDDDNNGTADANPVTRLLADASAKVAGYLRGIYSLDAVAATTPEEVKRITLDVAHAYLMLRHPEWVRGDGHELMKLATAELKDLRNGVSRLDVEGSPEPAANTGGTVIQGDLDVSESVFAPTFGHGFGDY